METKAILLKPLLLKAEAYGKTSFELLKLKSIDKTAEVTSKVISRLFLWVVLFLAIISLTVAVALWFGELTGKNYLGFLIVAGFYALIGSILFLLQRAIQASLNNTLIKQMLS